MADTTVIQNPGSGTNRIEVTGNSARNVQVRCPDGSRKADVAASNVNSVNIDGRALQGKTVIVSGRNSRDIHADADADADCRGGAPSNANVNSVNIR
ncbi:hypothetical protein [Variovorax sp. DT-64]|uniref:hypothetical protein n=1 Tax=Variovorax sp. DT-64 TaxID=3396160 RepID=UPI003F1B3352